ncbi:MAG: YbhN family protein [Candidatus Nanopelagicales bacterium]
MALAPTVPEQDAAPPPPLDKKKTLILGAVGLVIIVLIFVKVIPQIGSYQDALTALQNMTPAALVTIVLAVLLYLAVYGLPFVAAVPGLSYWHSFQLNQAAFAISNGVPAGGAFGLGIQYAMLASYEVTPTASTAAIGAVGVWSMFVTLLLPILGVIAIAASGQAAGSYVYIGVIGLVVLVVMIVVFALIMRSEPLARRLGRITNKVAGPLLRRLRKGREFDAVPAIVKFRTDIVGLVRRRWSGITAAQLGVSLTQFLIFFAALRGVESSGPTTAIGVAFGAFAVAQIGLMIPLPPGGLGTVDATMIALLTSMGVSAGNATAADLVWRAASFVPQIIIGVLALVTWSKRAAHTLAAKNPTAA